MAQLVNVSVDLTKVDKSKLITGQKGTYLNLTIEVKDEKDQFNNDVSAWQSQDKDERDAKMQRNYLGNGRVIWSGESQQSTMQSNQASQSADALNDLL